MKQQKNQPSKAGTTTKVKSQKKAWDETQDANLVYMVS